MKEQQIQIKYVTAHCQNYLFQIGIYMNRL